MHCLQASAHWPKELSSDMKHHLVSTFRFNILTRDEGPLTGDQVRCQASIHVSGGILLATQQARDMRGASGEADAVGMHDKLYCRACNWFA